MNLYQKLGYAGTLLLISCTSQQDVKKAAAQEVLQDISMKVWQTESDIYLSEGFEFTPGGGYWYYPKGMKALSAQQREEISNRIELRTAGLSKLEKAIDELREKYK